MMRHIACTLALALVVSGCAGFTYGHGGGLDAQGCHRDSSTGTRHCHESADEDVDGDAVIIAVVVVAVLAAIGLTAWAIYEATKDDPPSGSWSGVPQGEAHSGDPWAPLNGGRVAQP